MYRDSTNTLNDLAVVQDLEVTNNACTSEEIFRLPKDPVFWQINDETRDYVARHGFERNENSDFVNSKRMYNDDK